MSDEQSVKAFSLASFFNDMGSDMIAPVWPLFVTSVLGGSASLLGFIEGLAVAVVAVSKMIAGWWSDYVGRRKPFIYTGYLLSSVSRLGYYFSSSALMLIPFRVLDRFGKIRGAPRNAMVAELTVKRRRGRAFGLLRSMDSLGAVVGTIITLLIINLVSIRFIILLAIIPSVVSVLVIVFFVKERRVKRLVKGFSFSMPLRLKRLVLVFSFFAFFSFTYSFLVLLAGDSGFSNSSVIILYLLLNIVYSSTAFFFGRLSDKFGRVKLLIAGLLLFAGSCLTAVLSFIPLAFFLFGLHLAVFDTVQKTLVSELAPAGRRGSVIGSFQMIVGLTAIPGGLFMGWLYDLGRVFPFIVGFFSALITALFLRSK